MTAMVTQPSRDGSLSRAARGSVLNLLGAAVAAVAMFAMAVAITRLSSPAEAGLFFSATSLFLIAINLGRLGTNTGVVYFISGARGRGEMGMARPYLRLAAGPVAVVALATSIFLFLGADPLAAWLSPENAEPFAQNLRLMAVLVPVAAVANLATAGTQGLGTMKVFSIVDQMLLPLTQLVLVTVVLVSGRAWLTPTSWALAYVPAALAAWIWWRRLVQRAEPLGRPAAPTSAKRFWRFTAPRALANVSQIVMQRLDIVLVGALGSLTAAAVYAAATRFLVLGQMAGRAISLSIQPLLGSALARADLTDARRLYQTCTAWLVLGTWPLYLLLINFAPHVLAIFGEGYRAGSPALILLCAAMLLATACGTVDIVLNMAGRSMWNLMNALIALAVFVTLDLWLIPRIGFMGAAIGWAAAIAVANILPLLQILQRPGLHPFGAPTLVAMGVNLVCFGLLPWLGLRLAESSVGWLLVGPTAGALGYVCFLVLWRRPLELGQLAQALRRKRSPGGRVGPGPQGSRMPQGPDKQRPHD